MTNSRIDNSNGLIFATCKICKKKNELITNQLCNDSIFRNRKYKDTVDKLLLSHAKGQSLNEYLCTVTDPFELYDISVVLEYVLDAIDRYNTKINISGGRINQLVYCLLNHSDTKMDFYNYDEEVLF